MLPEEVPSVFETDDKAGQLEAAATHVAETLQEVVQGPIEHCEKLDILGSVMALARFLDMHCRECSSDPEVALASGVATDARRAYVELSEWMEDLGFYLEDLPEEDMTEAEWVECARLTFRRHAALRAKQAKQAEEDRKAGEDGGAK